MSKQQSVEESFLEALSPYRKPENNLLLACSGGLDSVVLAYLLHGHGFRFGIAHCNFNLRGAESDRDAAFVAALAKELDAPHHARNFTTRKVQRSGESLQMAARRIRYEYFEEVLDEYNYTYLLTAHHLDDGLETFFINLERGTGLAGLRGILSAGTTLRPLGYLTRKQLEEYAEANNIRWREDATNQQDVYRRNRIRHHLIPGLKEVLPTLEKTLPETFLRLQTQYELLEAGLALLWERAATADGEGWQVELTLLPNNPDQRRYVLNHFLGFAGFDGAQWAKGLSSAGRTTISSKTHQAYFADGKLHLTPLPSPAAPITIGLRDLPREVSIGGQVWEVALVARPVAFGQPGDVHYLSLAPEDFPLHLRPRQTGDRFQPYGMEGKSQSLKDFITNNKLSQRERNSLRVLETSGGEIAAVLGYRSAAAFAVKSDDQRVLRIQRRQ